MRNGLFARIGTTACMGCILLGLSLLGAPAATRGAHLGPTQFEVSARGANITGDLYGRLLPMSALQVGLARIVDLDREPGYRPWIKTNGIGLPTYRSGWHRLRDWERALVFLTPGNLAVYVPTNLGYALLVAPDQPAAFLAALQQPGAGRALFQIAGR